MKSKADGKAWKGVRTLRTAVAPIMALLLCLGASQATAAGFRLPEAGAKAMGMGFAFTAQADDPSAIYFNPAGLTQLEGSNVMGGVTYVKENGGTFTGETPLTGGFSTSETQKTLHFFIPNLYVTRKASPNFAYGIGVFSPFGLGQEYKDQHTSIFRNQVTKIDLQTVVVNPSVAWKVNEVLSLGAGIDFMYGKATLKKTPVGLHSDGETLTPTNIFDLELKGDGTAWGYNFGLLLTPSKAVRIGASFRSPFELQIKDGDVTISDVTTQTIVTPFGSLPPQAPAPIGFGGSSFSTKASTTLSLPATAALGIAVKPTDRLTVEVDADWTFWSSYRTLAFDFRDNRAFLPDSSSKKNWKDVCAIRIGGEYKVTDPLALRLGFAYDPTPVPNETMSPELPDATRLNYMAGVGYKIGNWTVDGSYFYVDKKDRTVDNLNAAAGTGFNGTWKGDAHVVALDLGYRF